LNGHLGLSLRIGARVCPLDVWVLCAFSVGWWGVDLGGGWFGVFVLVMSESLLDGDTWAKYSMSSGWL